MDSHRDIVIFLLNKFREKMLCRAASYPADSTIQQQLSTDRFQACSDWELSRMQKKKQSSAIHTRTRAAHASSVYWAQGWTLALCSFWSVFLDAHSDNILIVSSYNIYYVPFLSSLCEQDNIWLIGAKTLKGFRQNNGANISRTLAWLQRSTYLPW